MIKFYTGSSWVKLDCDRSNDGLKEAIAELMDSEVEDMKWKVSNDRPELFVIFDPYYWSTFRELYLEIYGTETFAKAMYDTFEEEIHN